ncbi:MAG TPA: hypothetical protein VFV50_17950 [Bdellovibrionales bacterium]|nr:hypothetical protein [Bdellovibrionales bacterium]
MKNKKLMILFCLFAFLLTSVIELDDADARRRRRRRPRRAYTLSPEVDLVVTFGDRVSVIQLVKDKKDYYLHFFNSAGQKKDLLLSKANYNYMVSQAQHANGGMQATDDCPRARVSLELKGKEVSRACLHSDSSGAKKLVELANTLSAPL